MADFPTWEAAASRCSGKPQPGSLELMAWAIETFGKRGLRNWGIYNCRTTVGGTNRSIHGDGRACDFGFALVNNRANPVGWEVVNMLLPHVRALGIQMIIWDRTIWSARTPNGAPYGGAGKSPHIDHVHVEQTWDSARTLTRERVRQIVRVGAASTPSTPPPTPTPTPTPAPAPKPRRKAVYLLKARDSDAIWITDGIVKVRVPHPDFVAVHQRQLAAVGLPTAIRSEHPNFVNSIPTKD